MSEGIELQLLLATLILTFCVCSAEVALPSDLLPDDVAPTEYHLTIVPYMEDSSPFFDCSLVINLLCKTPTTTFRFHSGASLGLTGDKLSLRSMETSERLDRRFLYDSETEQFTVTSWRTIRRGERFSIVVESYRTNYSTNGLGFYRYPLKNRIDLTATQFQENEARQVFPCFDEPRFRAVFYIVMFRKEALRIQTRSNAKLRKTIQFYPGWLADIYEPTLPMPTYTIAFAAFSSVKYQVHEKKVRLKQNEVKISLIHNPEESIIAANASNCNNCHCEIAEIFDVTVKFMRYMEAYLDIPYPMTKYDLLISRNAQYAGMENMGLVIMKRSGSCSHGVYGHEAIHQWLGNIVTPYWWGDLWLSEGLTTFFEQKVFEILFPERKWVSSMTIKKSTYAALHEDGEENSTIPAITHKRSLELDEKMTVIYFKSSTLMRMLYSIIGDDVLQASLKRYFQLYKYSHVTHKNFIDQVEQFWNASNSSGINIRSFMETWLHEPGYPIVKFTRVKDQIIAQQYDRLNRDRIWQIPLVWSLECKEMHGYTSSSARMQYLMTHEIEVLPVKVKHTDCFLSNQLLQFYYLPIFDNRTFEILFDMFDKMNEKINDTWQQQLNETIYVSLKDRKDVYMYLDSFAFLGHYLNLSNINFPVISEYYFRVTTKLREVSNLISSINRILIEEDKRRKQQRRDKRRRRRRRRRKRKKRGRRRRFQHRNWF